MSKRGLGDYEKRLKEKRRWLRIAKAKGLVLPFGGAVAGMVVAGPAGGLAIGLAAGSLSVQAVHKYQQALNDAETAFKLASSAADEADRKRQLDVLEMALGQLR